MDIGRLNKRVQLANAPTESGDADGFFEPLRPERVWASIEPLPAGDSGRTLQHIVTMRYHAQVTMDTRILYYDASRIGPMSSSNPRGARELFVRGFQNVRESGAELVLLCEEVVP